jgi:hypothetical protein
MIFTLFMLVVVGREGDSKREGENGNKMSFASDRLRLRFYIPYAVSDTGMHTTYTYISTSIS